LDSSKMLVPKINDLTIFRSVSFLKKTTGAELWKSVTSVSNAGMKRGRGKGVGKKRSKDLNRGQIIGVGHRNMVWPGLNAPVIQGKELVKQRPLPKDPEYEKKIHEMRDKMGLFKPNRLDPMERGWSGTKLPGRSIGKPDPIGDETFEGFDCKALEMKTVVHMDGKFGRVRTMSMFAVCGNGDGLGGFALSKGTTVQSVMRNVKNRSIQKLLYIERYNDHTVLHDFFSQFGCTKLFVRKVPEGYGLVCHRAIRTICQVIGIKDIYVKVEGAINVQNITKAFFLGLMRQKTHQQLADEKRLHLVEFREENLNFPKVVASPTSAVRKTEEIPKNEDLDFTMVTMDGKVVLKRKKFPPFYVNLPSYIKHLKKQAKFRNHPEIRHHLQVEYGEVRSFLQEKHPECKQGYVKKEEEVY